MEGMLTVLDRSQGCLLFKVWNLDTMLPMQTLSRHEGSVNCVVIHKDLLLSGSEDMEIKVSILLNNRITILLSVFSQIPFGYFELSIALSPEIPIPNRGRMCLSSARGVGRL